MFIDCLISSAAGSEYRKPFNEVDFLAREQHLLQNVTAALHALAVSRSA